MKKRLMSFLTAVVMTFTAMPLYANASDYETYTNIYDGLKGYTLVSDHLDLTAYSLKYSNDCAVFKNADGKLRILSPLHSICYVYIKDESKTNEIVDIIKSQMRDTNIDMQVNETNCIRIYSKNDISEDESEKLCSALTENNLINGFEYLRDRFYVAELEADDIDNAYRTITDGLGNIGRILNTQLYDGIWQVSEVLYDSISKEETSISYDISLNINTEAVGPVFVSTSSTTSITTLLTTVQGDANCDGILNMADAVIIMQSLANPNKYGENGTDKNHITELGKKNADITGDNDGITNADALAIQKKLLKLE